MTELLGYTAAQVRAAEAPFLDAGVPLMRRAATALAEVVREQLALRPRTGGPGEAEESNGGRVLALVGPGNNGGDALFAVAELAAAGAEVLLLAVVPGRWHDEGHAAAISAGARDLELASDPESDGFEDRIADLASTADVIVDGMFGTGSAGRESVALRGLARSVVRGLLRVPADRTPRVVAVDVPSGIDADTGAVPDPAVLSADVTATFGGVKAGLLLRPAAGYAGEVRLIDIGIGSELEKHEPAVRTRAESQAPPSLRG